MTSPRTLTDEEILRLPPSEREAYFQQRAESGVDDGGLIGWMQRIGAQVKGSVEAGKFNDRQVRELSSADRQYVEGLNPSNADYQGHDHSAMKQYVSQNLDPADVSEISDAYHQLHLAFQDFAQQLKDAVSKSQHEWEGDAAEQAHGYFSSLSTWADSNSQNAQLASEVMYQQSEAASTAKNSMPEEVPFDWGTEFKKWASNPLGMADNIDNTLETYQRSQEAHAEAARVMTQYDNDLFIAASKQPVFAEPPKFGTGGSGGVRMPSTGGPISVPGGDSGTSASGYSGGSIPGTGTGPGGSGVGGSFSAPGGSGGSSGGGGYTPMPAPLPSGRNTGAGMPSGTRPSGYRPPTTTGRVPSGGGSNSGFGGMGAMPVGGMAAGGMGGGGSDYSSKLGRGGSVGGFGPGGSGAAGGVGAGPGAASGAARPGMGGMPGAAPGAAAAAGGAGRGAGGMGAMGAGAGRGGQGGDDAEHQRPTYLVEGDPDEVFGTDERTAPPVIGE